MWRKKSVDIAFVNQLVENLEAFKHLKDLKWEKVDEQVQKSILPGSPSEDWIIPPDENETLSLLMQDSEYESLRHNLTKAIPQLKEIARFLQFNEHHDFDWLTFKTTPLMGNDALEDGLVMARRLLMACKKENYIWKNLLNVL